MLGAETSLPDASVPVWLLRCDQAEHALVVWLLAVCRPDSVVTEARPVSTAPVALPPAVQSAVDVVMCLSEEAVSEFRALSPIPDHVVTIACGVSSAERRAWHP